MKPGKSHGEQPTAQLLREHARRLFDNLPGARVGQEEAIHQIRVAARRLRAALPVAACKPGGRRLRRSLKSLRALTRLAGQGRDLDVCASLFETEAPRIKAPPAVVRVLRGRLQTVRRHAHAGLAKALAAFDANRLRGDLDHLIANGGTDLAEAALRLAGSSRKHARTALDELRALGRHFAPMSLHAIRRHCRWLRYAGELDRALFAGRASAVQRFKGLQEILGKLHDAFVLADWIAREASSWEAQGKLARAAAVRPVVAHFRDRAQAWHRRFLSVSAADWLESALQRSAALSKRAASL